MTNGRAGKADCTIWGPNGDQRSRLRPGNTTEWKNLLSVIMAMSRGWPCFVNRPNTGK